MNRKAETFFDAITRLREDLVEDAQNHVFRKRRSGWRKFGSLAACMALVASLGMLAALPKGCGGSDSSGADMNSSGAPMAAPPDVNVDAASGGAEPGDGAPPSGEQSESTPPASVQPVQFTAAVIEVRENTILVEPVDFDSQDRYLVFTAGLDTPDLAEGDWVSITCTALVPDADPPMVLGAQSIEKADGP